MTKKEIVVNGTTAKEMTMLNDDYKKTISEFNQSEEVVVELRIKLKEMENKSENLYIKLKDIHNKLMVIKNTVVGQEKSAEWDINKMVFIIDEVEEIQETQETP